VRAEETRRGIAAAVTAIVLGALATHGSAATPADAPILAADELGQPGWTGGECQAVSGFETCYYDHDDGSVLALAAWPLRPFDEVQVMVDGLSAASCIGGAPIEVGGRAATAGCTVRDATFGTSVALVFGNDSWTFVATLIPPGESSAEQVTFLLELRDRQLAAAGGEPRPVEPVSPEAATLDRYMPAKVPGGLSPPGGIVTSFDSLGRLTDEELTLPQSDWDFLQRRVSSRARLWTDPGGYYLAVIVTEFPYEVLAGLALGSLEGSAYRPIAADAARAIDDLLAVDATPAGAAPFVVEAFRRGRLEFRIAASGPDLATSEQLASTVAADVHRLAPSGGPRAPLHPPGALVSLGQAVLATAVVGVGVLLLRRLLAGRARPVPPLRAPTAVITDVGDRAAALRRSGRRLAAEQIGGCAVIVVGLVADIGWWWIAVAACGLLIGVLATAHARRRELERTARAWSVGSWRVVAIGTVSVALLVFGVALAVRALKESVLLPSLTHLRLSERLALSPSKLGAVMAIAGVGSLVFGALLMRRARAHARTALGSAGHDDRPPILYLRSFDDDALTVPSVHSARRPFFELFGLRGRDPFEEGIAWELATHGPVSAIGRPGRSVVSLGASRELLDPEAWQEGVAERMAKAGWIAVAVGSTDGLAWELGELTRNGHLTKSEFVVPPCPPEEVTRRWAITRRSIEHAAGRAFIAPVDVVGTFTLRVDQSSGAVSATRADRVDEAGYRAAIEVAFDTRPTLAAEARAGSIPGP
jgi:hypothetical protein